MLRVQKIATAILFNLNEMYARKHSDIELIEAINSIIRTVNIILINKESNWITKSTTLKIKNGKSKVPSDFGKIKSITETDSNWDKPFCGDYQIVKDTMILTKKDQTEIVNTLTMYYYYMLDEVSEMTDEIDLPELFYQLFIEYVTGLIDGTFGKTSLDNLVTSQIDSLSGATNYPFIERPAPFYV